MFHSGFLVIRDPVNTMANGKKLVPGLLGLKVFRQLSEMLKTFLRDDYVHQMSHRANNCVHVLALYEENIGKLSPVGNIYEATF